MHECREYLDKCIRPEEKLSEKELSDQVIIGDFFEKIALIPDGVFPLIIVDPPYNLTKDYAGEIFRKSKKEEYEAFTRRWLKEIRRVAAENASVYVCCDWATGVIVAPILSEFFTVRNRITWQREKGRGAKSNWKNCAEDVWFCTVGETYTFHLDAVKQVRKVKAPYRENGLPKDWTETENGKMRSTCPSNFWDDLTVPFWSMAENTAHPTQKPEKLMAKIILASSDEGDLVFDPFAGAGTSAVTAKKLNRRYCAVEQSELYCAWAQIRLRRAETDKRIQGFQKGVFIKE